MAGIDNDGANKQDIDNNDHKESNIYEDEINLMDYFLVLWKHKWLILLGSVLPALIVGLFLFSLPVNYELTYVYDVRDDVRDWNLNEKNYNVLISRFYSEENLSKITNKLRENGLNEYAKLIGIAGNSLDALQDLLKFEPVPPYIDTSQAKINDPEQLNQIRKLTAQLLNITIAGTPKENLSKIAMVIRGNFEKVVPIYSIEQQVVDVINRYRTQMADIEAVRFSLDLSVKTNKAVLERLKKIELRIPDKSEDNVMLQFDIGSKSEYLPLGYQIRAAEAKIVELEESIGVNEAKYNHYKNLSALYERLAAQLKDKKSAYYTIEQYHTFLTELTGEYKTDEIKDYLASYIKKIENRISASTPVSQTPKIFSIAKGTVKKGAIVFVMALMMSVFVSFLLEGLKKSQTRVP